MNSRGVKERLPRKSDVGELLNHPEIKYIVMTLVMVRKVIMRILRKSMNNNSKVKYIEYNRSAFLKAPEVVEIRWSQMTRVLIIQK